MSNGHDLFGRVRVAPPYTLADLTHLYGIDAFDYESVPGTGTIAYDGDKKCAHLTASANGAAPRLRTWEDYRYQAGKAQRWLMTIIHDDEGVANQKRRWGYYDGDDGLFFELNGTDLRLMIRSHASGSTVDTPIERADWNVDRLDGTGPSGLTLGSDLLLTDDAIYECAFQWLSVGPVRWFINGAEVHVSLPPITAAAPFMANAQLPLTCEVVNGAATASTGFRYVCASVTSDGGSDPPEHGFGYSRAAVSVGTTEIPLISLRAGALFNSIRSRRVLIPSRVSYGSETQRASIGIRWNATLTGATWAVTTSGSSAEIDIAASAVSGGIELERLMIPAGGGVNALLSESFQRHGRKLRARAGDIVTITGVNEGAATTNMRGSLSWREVR